MLSVIEFLTAGIAALCFDFDIYRGKFVVVSVVDRVQEFNRFAMLTTEMNVLSYRVL